MVEIYGAIPHSEAGFFDDTRRPRGEDEVLVAVDLWSTGSVKSPLNLVESSRFAA